MLVNGRTTDATGRVCVNLSTVTFMKENGGMIA